MPIVSCTCSLDVACDCTLCWLRAAHVTVTVFVTVGQSSGVRRQLRWLADVACPLVSFAVGGGLSALMSYC
jgi:hypothetical protein